MNKLNKVIIIGSKIIEVLYWIVDVLAVAGLAALVLLGGFVRDFLVESYKAGTITVNAAEGVDKVEMLLGPAIYVVVIGAIIGCTILALIFRRVNRVFKIAEGETEDSVGKTPFQPAVVKMIKEIGWLSISLPVIDVVVEFIEGVILKSGVHATVEVTALMFGIVILSLAQFFEYGVKLEDEVDGLL